MQSNAECPAASEAMQLRVSRDCHDLGLSFFAIACLALWRNGHEPRIALPTTRPINLLDRVCERACDSHRRGCVRKTKSPTARLKDFSPPGDVAVDIAETEPVLEESVTPPPLEEIHSNQDSFTEEVRTPPPVRTHRKARTVSLLRGATTESLRSVKAMVAYAPRPIYSYEARRQRVTKSGIALVTVDQTSGTVTDVLMTQSTGNAILDNSTLDALRRWRFKPGNVTVCVRDRQAPIECTNRGEFGFLSRFCRPSHSAYRRRYRIRFRSGSK